jgi:hypothetical protein
MAGAGFDGKGEERAGRTAGVVGVTGTGWRV